jgi:hypothetical protein
MGRNEVRPLALAGIAMVVAFFGPWLDFFGLVQASGLDLATSSGAGWKRHLLWLYPVGGATLATLAWRADARARAFAFFLGGAVVALALYDTASSLAQNVRYGCWITIGGALVAFACGLTRGDRGWSVVGGALILIGFFLPWLGEGRGAMSGWDLARLAHAPDPLPSPKWLYLIPLLGVTAALSGVTAGARGRIVSVIAGAAVIGVLAFLYIRTLNMVLGWGAWLTLLSGLASLAGALLLTASRRRLTPAARPC